LAENQDAAQQVVGSYLSGLDAKKRKGEQQRNGKRREITSGKERWNMVFLCVDPKAFLLF